MVSGYIYVICNFNFGWDSKFECYYWFFVFFEEQDVLLQCDDCLVICDFVELCGKILGISLGYVYVDDFMQVFVVGEICCEDICDLVSCVQMFKCLCLDVVVDMCCLLFYLMCQYFELGLSVSLLVLQSYWMYCIYGG